MIKNPYEFMKEYSRQGIMFCFNGSFSEMIVTEIVDMLKKIMTEQDASHSAIFNLFSIVVEMLQNINFYSASRTIKIMPDRGNYNLGLGIIFAGIQDDDFVILSGNPIENNRIDKLRNKLLKISKMDKNELRQYYKAQLKTVPDDDSMGGGVGLIEIARKSNKPIEFNFQEIDDRFSFFSLQICINRN